MFYLGEIKQNCLCSNTFKFFVKKKKKQCLKIDWNKTKYNKIKNKGIWLNFLKKKCNSLILRKLKKKLVELMETQLIELS